MTIQFSDAAKAKQIRDFFQENGRIYVVIDATHDDVNVPDFLKGDPALRLVLNHRMPQPIYIRDDALVSEFSFSGQSYACSISMPRIWAAYQPEGDIEQGLIWEDCVPETIRTVVNAARGLAEDEAGDAKESASTSTSIEASQPDNVQEARKVRHLRVVK